MGKLCSPLRVGACAYRNIICDASQYDTNNRSHSNPLSIHTQCVTGTRGSLGLFGLRGMGGVGKTTTAIAVARSDRVQRTFGPDNIWWITVGQKCSGMAVLEEFARKVCRCESGGECTGVWVCEYAFI